MYDNFCERISGTLTGSQYVERNASCLTSCESEPGEGCHEVWFHTRFNNATCFEICKDLGNALYYTSQVMRQ